MRSRLAEDTRRPGFPDPLRRRARPTASSTPARARRSAPPFRPRPTSSTTPRSARTCLVAATGALAEREPRAPARRRAPPVRAAAPPPWGYWPDSVDPLLRPARRPRPDPCPRDLESSCAAPDPMYALLPRGHRPRRRRRPDRLHGQTAWVCTCSANAFPAMSAGRDAPPAAAAAPTTAAAGADRRDRRRRGPARRRQPGGLGLRQPPGPAPRDELLGVSTPTGTSAGRRATILGQARPGRPERRARRRPGHRPHHEHPNRPPPWSRSRHETRRDGVVATGAFSSSPPALARSPSPTWPSTSTDGVADSTVPPVPDVPRADPGDRSASDGWPGPATCPPAATRTSSSVRRCATRRGSRPFFIARAGHRAEERGRLVDRVISVLDRARLPLDRQGQRSSTSTTARPTARLTAPVLGQSCSGRPPLSPPVSLFATHEAEAARSPPSSQRRGGPTDQLVYLWCREAYEF